jgi:predicted TIM-barrel fold metal-dependent hydrolase
MRELPVLFDLERRFAIMDGYPDYVQVLTLASPPIDEVVSPDAAVTLARIANDEMAALVDRYPTRFLAFAATLPMSTPSGALAELNRAVQELGAAGAQLYTSINGRPLDHPNFAPVFRRLAELDLPIWLHPTRTATFIDYPSEKRSAYDIWWTFGWPYETSAAMTRIVFSGILERHPNLKIITHHCGGMIPYLEGRVGPGLDQLGTRTDDASDALALAHLSMRPLDYYKLFYADTALFGSSAGLDCGLAFFGAERVLFGTDMPFDPEGGAGFVRETIAAIERTRTSPIERQLIYEDNARRLLPMPAAVGDSSEGA